MKLTRIQFASLIGLGLTLVIGCGEEESVTATPAKAPAQLTSTTASTTVDATVKNKTPSKDAAATINKELTPEEIDGKLANRKSHFEAPFKKAASLFRAPEVPQGIVATPIKVEKTTDKKPTVEAKLRLLGFAELGDDERMAIVEFKGEVHTLRIGDKLEDAKVISLDHNEIALQRGSERINTKLFEQAWSTPATAPIGYVSTGSSSKSRSTFKPTARPVAKQSPVTASPVTAVASSSPVPGMSMPPMGSPAEIPAMPAAAGALPGMSGPGAMPGSMPGVMSMPGGAMGAMPGGMPGGAGPGMAGPPN